MGEIVGFAWGIIIILMLASFFIGRGSTEPFPRHSRLYQGKGRNKKSKTKTKEFAEEAVKAFLVIAGILFLLEMLA